METLRWKIVYPKYKKGEAVAKKVKVDSTFSKPGNTTISADTLYILLHAFITTVYADTIWEKVRELSNMSDQSSLLQILLPEAPPPIPADI